MAVDITWRGMKILLGINNMHQYRDFVAQCPDITMAVRLRSSSTTKSGFDYGVIESYKVLDTNLFPSTTDSNLSPSSGIDDESYVFDVDLPHPDHVGPDCNTRAQPDPCIISAEESPSTPKQANVIQAPVTLTQAADNDDSITTNCTMDTIDPTQDITWVATEEATGFHQVHYRLFDAVQIWMQNADAKKVPFHLKWQKAVFRGLTALTKWDRVAALFKLSNPRDYITLMNECPGVQEHFELTWDFFENTVRYKELALPATEDILQDISKLNALQRKMQQLAFKFDSCMQQYHTRLADTDARITKYEVDLAEQLNRASSRIASSATKHYESLSVFASTTFGEFQSNVDAYTAQSLTTQRGKIIDMHHANHDVIQATARDAEHVFKARLDEAIERAIQEILVTADEATDHMNQQADQLLANMATNHT